MTHMGEFKMIDLVVTFFRRSLVKEPTALQRAIFEHVQEATYSRTG